MPVQLSLGSGMSQQRLSRVQAHQHSHVDALCWMAAPLCLSPWGGGGPIMDLAP